MLYLVHEFVIGFLRFNDRWLNEVSNTARQTTRPNEGACLKYEFAANLVLRQFLGPEMVASLAWFTKTQVAMASFTTVGRRATIRQLFG